MSDIPKRVHEYLVDKLIPTKQVHLIAGASGAGKSTLLIQLVRDMLDGKPWFGRYQVKHPITLGYVSADRDVLDIEYKMKCMGIAPFPVLGLVGFSLGPHEFDPLTVSTPNGRKEWITAIHKHLGSPSVLVVDPLSPFLPADPRYHAQSSALIHLSTICLKRDFTLLGTGHAGKLTTERTFPRKQDRILGSSALQGYSGTQMMLTDSTEVPNTPGYHIFTINPHNAPAEEILLDRIPSTGMFKVWEDAEEFVMESKLLKCIPFAPDKISLGQLVTLGMEVIDRGEKTVRRHLDKLIVAGFVEKAHHGHYSRRKES